MADHRRVARILSGGRGTMRIVTWTQNDLVEDGFSGLVRFAELPGTSVPAAPGVYVIVRPTRTDPAFLDKSPAGWFKGKDPSVPLAALENAWVPRSEVVYIG